MSWLAPLLPRIVPLHQKNFSFLILSWPEKVCTSDCPAPNKTLDLHPRRSLLLLKALMILLNRKTLQTSARSSSMTQCILPFASFGPGAALRSHPGVPITKIPVGWGPTSMHAQSDHGFVCSKGRVPHCWHMFGWWKRLSLWRYLGLAHAIPLFHFWVKILCAVPFFCLPSLHPMLLALSFRVAQAPLCHWMTLAFCLMTFAPFVALLLQRHVCKGTKILRFARDSARPGLFPI